MVASVREGVWNETRELWEEFALVFQYNVKKKIEGFIPCDFSLLKSSKDKLVNIIFLIKMSIIYIIRTQEGDEELMSFFGIVNELNSKNKGLLKDWFIEIINFVNKPELEESFVEQSTYNNPSIQEFEGKLNEYELTITNLQDRVSDLQNKQEKKDKVIEDITKRNEFLEEEIMKQEILLRSIGNNQTNQFENKIEELTNNFDKRIKLLNEKLTESESYRKMQESQLRNLMEENKQIEKEKRIQIKSLKQLPVSHISRDVYEKLRNEKNEIEQRLLELETTLATEISEKDSLQFLNNKLKTDHQKALNKQQTEFEETISDLKAKIVDLQKQSNKRQRTATMNSTQNSAKQDGIDTMTSSQQQNQFLESTFGQFTSDLNSIDDPRDNNYATNFQVLERFDMLQERFEELREKSKKENESLKYKIKTLTEELMSVKSKNNNLSTNRSNAYASLKDLGSQELAYSKRKSRISEELMDKIMLIEKENKKLKFTNNMLQERLIKNTGRFNEQLDILHSVITAYTQFDL